MRLPRRQFLHLSAGAPTLPAVSRIAQAQVYPTRPVRIMIGSARLMGNGCRNGLANNSSSSLRGTMRARAVPVLFTGFENAQSQRRPEKPRVVVSSQIDRPSELAEASVGQNAAYAEAVRTGRRRKKRAPEPAILRTRSQIANGPKNDECSGGR